MSSSGWYQRRIDIKTTGTVPFTADDVDHLKDPTLQNGEQKNLRRTAIASFRGRVTKTKDGGRGSWSQPTRHVHTRFFFSGGGREEDGERRRGERDVGLLRCHSPFRIRRDIHSIYIYERGHKIDIARKGSCDTKRRDAGVEGAHRKMRTADVGIQTVCAPKFIPSETFLVPRKRKSVLFLYRIPSYSRIHTHPGGWERKGVEV